LGWEIEQQLAFEIIITAYTMAHSHPLFDHDREVIVEKEVIVEREVILKREVIIEREVIVEREEIVKREVFFQREVIVERDAWDYVSAGVLPELHDEGVCYCVA
jgi:UDP-3-O-[3-hydroxymyristoyl] glucosamine N-acyltransferase